MLGSEAPATSSLDFSAQGDTAEGEKRKLAPRATPDHVRERPLSATSKADGSADGSRPWIETSDAGERPFAAHPLQRPAHPSSPARAQLLEQRERFSAIAEALRKADLDSARRLIEEHKQRYPEDESWRDRVEGFGIIVSCMERGSAETRQAAERFIAEYSASPMRRRVRRACLSER